MKELNTIKILSAVLFTKEVKISTKTYLLVIFENFDCVDPLQGLNKETVQVPFLAQT